MKTWSDYGISVNETAVGEYATTCPQCSPGRKKKGVKCLSVNVEKEVWYCNHCAWAGTLKSGAENKGDYKHWQKPQYKRPEYKPISDLPTKVVEWFASRGISEKVLVRNKVNYDSVYMPQEEDFVKAIRFPFFRKGECINIKSRDGKKNFRMETGAERIFYGLDDAAETVIIVEGEIDKLSIEEAGYLNCWSVPDGAPSPKAKDYTSKFEFLENCEELETVKTFILAVDNDDPGKVLQAELARRLGKERCKLVTWPVGCKDANEVLVNHGMLALKNSIQAAAEFPIDGLFTAKDLYTSVCSYYENGYARGESTGWPGLDEFYTVKPGEFTVVSGMPSCGKSEFLDALLLNLTTIGWKFAIFSPENYPLERHIAKLSEKITGKPFFNRYGKRMSYDEMVEAQGMLNKHFTFMVPPEDQLSLDGILALARTVAMRKGVNGIVIDPWNEIDHSRDKGMSETEYIHHALGKFRRFAREFNLHLWIVAHPTKMRKDEKGQYPVPTLYDINGSAAWRNKADNGFVVHRDVASESDEVYIHVQKIKFKDVGKIGKTTLHYDYVTGRYHE